MAEERERIGFELGMGWLPDYPDFRDYTVDTPEIASRLKMLGQEPVKVMLQRVGVAEPEKVSLPLKQDLRAWCSPIENQRQLGSCTAQAGVGLVEYYERRAHGTHIDASRLFLYKATRNLLKWTGDTGAFLRSTAAAMVLFGIPPEEYWPYTDAKPDFDEEPSAFCYSFAQNYQALQYFRLDPPGTAKDALLTRIKTFIAAGLPSMFGFAVFSSIRQAQDDGKIPFPCVGERVLGGHAVVAVGFDDKIKIENRTCKVGERETTGALLVRNSWGTGWGDAGYGWLPYKYVLKGQAIDWWSVLRKEWVDTEVFGL